MPAANTPRTDAHMIRLVLAGHGPSRNLAGLLAFTKELELELARLREHTARLDVRT